VKADHVKAASVPKAGHAADARGANDPMANVARVTAIQRDPAIAGPAVCKLVFVRRAAVYFASSIRTVTAN
jgi:hypothetical protein